MSAWKTAWRGMGWWRWLCLALVVLWIVVFAVRVVGGIGT